MKITYTIQVCNESRELFSLLNFLGEAKDPEDDIQVVVDSRNVTDKVEQVLDYFSEKIKVLRRPFDNFHTNAQFHADNATGDYIFGIDADEMPQWGLVKTVKRIIAETGVEILYVPRMNIHPGATEKFTQDYGFQTNEAGFVNWPDYQGRVWKRCPYIKLTEELHTKLTGSDKVLAIKPDVSLGIWHIKSIEKQMSRWQKDETGNYTIHEPMENSLYDKLM